MTARAPLRRALAALAGLLAAPALSGCGGSAAADGAVLRLGYFANVTHAGPVYGVGTGTYQRALAPTRLVPRVFRAGPSAVEALFAGALDAAYLGPSPAVNAFVRSDGMVRIVAGATAGGASLVVRPGITSAAQLRGRTIADPQLGGTQDVALRSYLAAHGFTVRRNGSGDVKVFSLDNASALAGFRAGRIDGGWLPEPWATRLVLQGGGVRLVDERSLWPAGEFVTTNLVVRTDYLAAHPDVVRRLLEGQVAADRAIAAAPGQAEEVVNRQLARLTGKSLPAAVIHRAFGEVTVTEDPLATTLRREAEHAVATGLVPRSDLRGIYDLTLLRQVLGRPVDDAGLGPRP